MRLFSLLTAALLLATFSNHTRCQDHELPYYLYDPGDEFVEGKMVDHSRFHDAGIAVEGKTFWMVWLEFVPGIGEQIWIGRQEEGIWLEKRKLSARPGVFSRPQIQVDKRGTIWVTYEAEVDGQWDLFFQRGQDATALSPPEPISDGAGSDINHRSGLAPDGSLWVVWQSDRDGQFDILARRITAAGNADDGIHLISQSSMGDWHPDLTVLSDGQVAYVWDSYDGESFNLLARTQKRNGLSSILPLAQSAAFEGRPSIASSKGGRVWVVWEEGAEEWGKEYRSAYYPNKVFVSLTDRRGPLHRFRKLHLVEWDVTANRASEAAPGLPMPSMELALKRPESGPEALPIGAFYERPRIVVDGHDRLWMAYRHYYAHRLGVGPEHHREQGFGVYARYLSGSVWSPLYSFAPDQGDGMQRMEIAPLEDGIAIAWTTGRTDRRPARTPIGVALAKMESTGEGGPPSQPDFGLARIGEAETVSADVEIPPSSIQPIHDHHLFFGDLHRHTDLSLCMVPADGTIDDAYRYAIEAANLDFLGITDHSRDIAGGDHLSLLWWRSRKEVTRHQLGTRFFPFYAYERSRRDTDHNVISLDPDVLRPYTYHLPVFWEEVDGNTITIPHQPFFNDGLWEYNDNERRPLLEIYQGCRDSTAEDKAQSGLGKDYRFGFIASSDHLSTAASYACVWAPERSRESIFHGLKSRRTYGATSKIQLAVRSGNHWMGEEFSASSPLAIQVDAVGTATVSAVDIIVDGTLAKTWRPGSKTVSSELSLPMEPGAHYVYLRLKQEDGHYAWASPFFVDVSN